MRVIHMSAEKGSWEAVVFTDERRSEAQPEDFIVYSDADRDGFRVDFDGDVDLPVGLLPVDGEAYVKLT